MGNLIIKHFVIIYLCNIIVSVHCTQNTTLTKLDRGKRYLDFQKLTRVFFRANLKNNILDINTIFAYAFGYRSNYPIENDKKRKLAMKRDIYQVLEKFMKNHGFDGEACILKSFCTSVHGGQHSEGILFKTFKNILSFEKLEYVPKDKLGKNPQMSNDTNIVSQFQEGFRHFHCRKASKNFETAEM